VGVRGFEYSSLLHIHPMCLMQAVRRQGQDARECSGADSNHQQQSDAK
jgi:hypothetical protein